MALKHAGIDTESAIVLHAANLEDGVSHVLKLQDLWDDVHFVLDRPSKARTVQDYVHALARDSFDGSMHQQVHVHVGDWSCTAPSLRARSASQPGVSLLSDHVLADLMGVGHLGAVMDGIAW